MAHEEPVQKRLVTCIRRETRIWGLILLVVLGCAQVRNEAPSPKTQKAPCLDSQIYKAAEQLCDLLDEVIKAKVPLSHQEKSLLLLLQLNLIPEALSNTSVSGVEAAIAGVKDPELVRLFLWRVASGAQPATFQARVKAMKLLAERFPNQCRGLLWRMTLDATFFKTAVELLCKTGDPRAICVLAVIISEPDWLEERKSLLREAVIRTDNMARFTAMLGFWGDLNIFATETFKKFAPDLSPEEVLKHPERLYWDKGRKVFRFSADCLEGSLRNRLDAEILARALVSACIDNFWKLWKPGGIGDKMRSKNKPNR